MRNPIAVMSISVFCGLAALVGVFHSIWKGYSDVYTTIFVLLAAGFIITGILAGFDAAYIKHKLDVYLLPLDAPVDEKKPEVDE